MLTPVPLNDYLSTSSNWPRRLLGWESYNINRNLEHVTLEYDNDRYTPILNSNIELLEQAKILEFENLNMPLDGNIFISLCGEDVFQTSVRYARHLWYAVIRSAAERFSVGSICELGCGYGFNLPMLGDGAYGGDFSASAVALAARLGQSVSSFNYYQTETYDFIKPNSTVMTVHSLEQIPRTSDIINNFRQYKDRINRFIHLEPCIIPSRSTLMGMIRNKYIELIHHNQDLIQVITSQPDVRILHLETDVFGLHPLNATHLLVWEFC